MTTSNCKQGWEMLSYSGWVRALLHIPAFSPFLCVQPKPDTW